ncbi:AzlD domain-containing protein, partial [Candidatus Pelagibacter sp.]|nr:AzlD domain-containing protein [Candidatus Pelagibacter sp.]
MHWSTIIYCGIITYLTRFSTLFLLKEDILNDKTKKILSYVPSAIFPAIIFPPIFLDSAGTIDIENNPKILAAVFAIIIGFFSRSIIATIFARPLHWVYDDKKLKSYIEGKKNIAFFRKNRSPFYSIKTGEVSGYNDVG